MSTNAGNAYSAADLARYHSGEMTASERHALEKAALHDPFLADALDGFEAAKTPAADMASLQRSLAARVQKEEKKRVFYMPRWVPRVAAACLLVGILGWLAYRLPFSESNPVALDAKPAVAEKTIESIAAPYTVADSAVVTSTSVATDSYELEKPSATEKKTRAKSSVGTATSVATTPVESPASPANQSSASLESVAPPAVVLQQQQFSGIITDTTGRAIPFASIKVAQTGTQLQSDAQGRFQVMAPDTAAAVTVSALGYQSRKQLLDRETDNRLVLAESKADLQEVVVTGYNTKKARAKSQVQEGQLEPKEGWSRYNDYLAESLQAPDKIAERPKGGEVTLSFDVNKQGEAVNIKVEKSLCETCDQKAVQLLKDGPKWKTGAKRRGKIVIRF